MTNKFVKATKASLTGFTMLEMITVVVIIGVLATMGFSQYSVFIEKSHGAEANGVLNLIYRNYRIARANNNDMNPVTAAIGPASTDWVNKLMMADPNANVNAWFSYYVFIGPPLIAEARRRTSDPRPPFSNINTVDAARWVRINLATGEITTCGRY